MYPPRVITIFGFEILDRSKDVDPLKAGQNMYSEERS